MREQLYRIPARTLLMSGWAVVALSLLACVLYGVMPPLKAQREAAGLLETLSSYALGDTDLAEQIAQRRRENAGIEQKLNGDLGGLPSKQLQTYIIGKLQAICLETRLEMQSVRPAKEVQSENLSTMEFEVELVGDYFDWFAWLGRIREELGFVTVRRYDIKPLNPAEADPRLIFTIKIAAYRGIEES